MPGLGVWQRHPRYVLLILLIFLTIFYLNSPYEPSSSLVEQRGPPNLYDVTLPGRVARAETIYAKVLRDRQHLIKKFGPTSNDIAMFPPDRDPWPPYTVWDFFPAAFNCPHDVERIGSLGDGGNWVCGLSRVQEKTDCKVYSIGINWDSSFEADILSNTQYCQIWGYSFSVNSFGSQIPRSQLSRVHFAPYGLAGVDAHMPTDQHKRYTVDSLMRLNGHTYVDILKVDIEGWEFDTFTTLVKTYIAADQPLPFGQLLIEIHAWSKKFPEFLSWWELLESAGLRPYSTETNLVYQNYNKQSNSDLAAYSFINIRGDNAFIADPEAVQPGERHGIVH